MSLPSIECVFIAADIDYTNEREYNRTRTSHATTEKNEILRHAHKASVEFVDVGSVVLLQLFAIGDLAGSAITCMQLQLQLMISIACARYYMHMYAYVQASAEHFN
jgi:hypothetical protein